MVRKLPSSRDRTAQEPQSAPGLVHTHPCTPRPEYWGVRWAPSKCPVYDRNHQSPVATKHWTHGQSSQDV